MVSPSTIDARLSLDREHEDQLTQSLRRRAAELPEHALDVLASRFVSSVQLGPQSLMKAEDLRRFFLESAEHVPIARLQEMIEAMDSTLEGNGSSEDDFATFLHQASDASKGIRIH
eukprot:TRINITY_DN10917_c0_g1_i3.p1 TRINITY_DN10917_c0_g1~~TRINITY_DN10917_c0_g1_i3.p1  ORF type:complete len:116 (+),score=13.10 TRINITY_DN10917_c0_g1_i3:132-479(+)